MLETSVAVYGPTAASARPTSSHDADAIIGDASGVIGVHTLKTVPLFDLRLTDLRVNQPMNISPSESQGRRGLAN